MERVIQTSMIAFLSGNGLISEHQHGFLAKRSTCTQLLATLNDWYAAVNRKKCVNALYIDLKSAFTSVVFDNLLYKLDKFGIKGNLHKWLAGFLMGWAELNSILPARSYQVTLERHPPYRHQ